MNDPTEVVTGHIEKPVDASVGNDRLNTNGHTDQTVGHVEQIVENAVRPIKKSVHNIMDRARLLAQRVVYRAKRMG